MARSLVVKVTCGAEEAERLNQGFTVAATAGPGLIGGLIVKVGSRMIDTSVRSKLNSLKIAMKEVG